MISPSETPVPVATRGLCRPLSALLLFWLHQLTVLCEIDECVWLCILSVLCSVVLCGMRRLCARAVQGQFNWRGATSGPPKGPLIKLP